MKNCICNLFVCLFVVVVLLLSVGGCSTEYESKEYAVNETSGIILTNSSIEEENKIEVAVGYSKYVSQEYEIAEEKNEESRTVINKINGFTADENVKNNAKNFANEQLEMLPDNVWELFCKKGWTLSLTSEKIHDERYPDATVMGYCDRTDKIIMLTTISTAYIQNSLLHEFGHFVYHHIESEKRVEFLHIYEENLSVSGCNKGYNSHCLSNVSEYFAESFKRYLRNQELAENVSNYMSEIISEI